MLHEIPEGELETVPLLVNLTLRLFETVTVTLRFVGTGANAAWILRFLVTGMMQTRVVPVQSPLHERKVCPAVGVAVRVRLVPLT